MLTIIQQKQRRRADNNCAIVSRSGYIWIWSRLCHQESTNHSAHFNEWKSSYITNMGYWPSVRSRWLDVGQILSLFIACLWTETESRSINSQKKKRTRPISSHLDRTSLLNKGTQRVCPSEQNSSTLPARVANHSAGFCSFCSLTELGI